MQLYLMQHGLAQSEESDPERALSPEGVAQVKAAAQGLRRLGLRFDLIMASPQRRSQQSAALVAEAVRYPYSDILTSETLLPNAVAADLMSVLEKETSAESVLVVGHLPHLANFVSRYTGGKVVFENAGLVCLECIEYGCLLKYLLTNTQLAML